MSEAWIPFQPAMEEPSNAWPDSNLSASKWETGTPTCCSLPRVSVKRRSTNLMPCSLISFRTSAADLDILESPKKNKNGALYVKQNCWCNGIETQQKPCQYKTTARGALCHICQGKGASRAPQIGAQNRRCALVWCAALIGCDSAEIRVFRGDGNAFVAQCINVDRRIEQQFGFHLAFQIVQHYVRRGWQVFT